jgi:hypothetical protein
VGVEEQRPAQAILERWRDLERQLAALEPTSIAAELVRTEIRQRRNEYQRLVAEAIADMDT